MKLNILSEQCRGGGGGGGGHPGISPPPEQSSPWILAISLRNKPKNTSFKLDNKHLSIYLSSVMKSTYKLATIATRSIKISSIFSNSTASLSSPSNDILMSCATLV